MEYIHPKLKNIQGFAKDICEALQNMQDVSEPPERDRLYIVLKTAMMTSVFNMAKPRHDLQKLFDFVLHFAFSIEPDDTWRNEIWFAWLFLEKFGGSAWLDVKLPLHFMNCAPTAKMVANYDRYSSENIAECADVDETCSNGERAICKFLEYNRIKYIFNSKIDNPYNLSERKHLRPDFQLPDHKIFIEFNGQQHYTFIKQFHETWQNFEQQQLRDIEMRRYCHEHDIKLIEIRYDQIDSIPQILRMNLSKFTL